MTRKVSERKIPFNCYLTLSQLQDLDEVAAEEEKPKAELVREAITEYLVDLAWINPDTIVPNGYGKPLLSILHYVNLDAAVITVGFPNGVSSVFQEVDENLKHFMFLHPHWLQVVLGAH